MLHSLKAMKACWGQGLEHQWSIESRAQPWLWAPPAAKRSQPQAKTSLGPLPALLEDPHNSGKKLSLCLGSPASLRRKHFCVVLGWNRAVLGSVGFQDDASTCQVLSRMQTQPEQQLSARPCWRGCCCRGKDSEPVLQVWSCT